MNGPLWAFVGTDTCYLSHVNIIVALFPLFLSEEGSLNLQKCMSSIKIFQLETTPILEFLITDRNPLP